MSTCTVSHRPDKTLTLYKENIRKEITPAHRLLALPEYSLVHLIRVLVWFQNFQACPSQSVARLSSLLRTAGTTRPRTTQIIGPRNGNPKSNLSGTLKVKDDVTFRSPSHPTPARALRSQLRSARLPPVLAEYLSAWLVLLLPTPTS